MYPIPGHLALSVLGNRYCKADWIPLLAGAFLPDLIDKPLNDVLHWTPYGRYAMHSLTGLLVSTGLAYGFFNKRVAWSYMIGHFLHLVGDADFNPWFWPFLTYNFSEGIDVLDIVRAPSSIFYPSWILMETVILILAGFLYTRTAEKKSVQAVVLSLIVVLSIYRITRKRPSSGELSLAIDGFQSSFIFWHT